MFEAFFDWSICKILSSDWSKMLQSICSVFDHIQNKVTSNDNTETYLKKNAGIYLFQTVMQIIQ